MFTVTVVVVSVMVSYSIHVIVIVVSVFAIDVISCSIHYDGQSLWSL